MKIQTENIIKLGLKEKLIITFYALLFIAAIVMLFLREGQDSQQANVVHSIKQAKELAKGVEKENKAYRLKILQLESNYETLKHLLAQTKNELDTTKSKAIYLRSQLVQLASRKNHDSFSGMEDSLAGLSLTYVALSDRRDSLCDSQVKLLQLEIENRDSAFLVCDSSRRKIDSSFLLLSKRHTELADQLLATQKKLKKQRRSEKIWKGTSALLTGAIITIWIKKQ